MLIDITTGFEAWSRTHNIENLVETAAHAAITGHQDAVSPQAELSIVLASDEKVRQLNAQYRGLDKATNVLSFPGEYDGGAQARNILLGDIVLAFETIEIEAQSQHKSFENHVSHLIIHGVLHLLGHDHEDDETARNMELLEISILKGLGIENPYA